ncbi:NCAM2 [Branchiostoma lanceolatum]|uniref:NCAM2 protein n=1 Tax=Branchiostoma lanceolatum TaxID=7740 RepID=A0A8K0EUZ5_BRALA|nr:NCAM2 [Branchiostoma lanceolatum]
MAGKTTLCSLTVACSLLFFTGVQCQVPGAPTINSFPVVAQTEVQINIGDPSDPGGSDVNDFSIQHRIAGSDDDWVLFRTRDGVGGTWVIDILEPSTTYEFRAAAINSDGTGPWTPLSEVTTLDPPTTTGATTTTTTGESTTGPPSEADGASSNSQRPGEAATTTEQASGNPSATPVAAIAAPVAIIVFMLLLVVAYLLFRRTWKNKGRWGKKGRGVQPSESNMEKGEEKKDPENHDGKNGKEANTTQGEQPSESQAHNGQSSLRPPYQTHIRAFSAA